ncbi:MAG TPA: TMEM175 family protein [Trebonia sp.]|nr:TMEM175 family protein [Trebonia sp.]
MSADGFDPAPPSAAPPELSATADGHNEGAGTERLLALSDGVVAIALTLLILGIQVPAAAGLRNPDSMSELAAALVSTIDGWISYVISFVVIAQFWLTHRQLFREMDAAGDGLANWNFLFLFTITVMPFTSDLIGKYPENPLAVIIFSANLILATLARFGMLRYRARHRPPAGPGRPAVAGYKPLQGIINLCFYALAIPVALVSPDLAKFCWLGLILSPRIAALIARRSGARAAG